MKNSIHTKRVNRIKFERELYIFAYMFEKADTLKNPLLSRNCGHKTEVCNNKLTDLNRTLCASRAANPWDRPFLLWK